MSPAEIMEEINASIGFDKALAPYDIRASKAHAAMLGQQGIISKDDARKIAAGLDRVLAEIEKRRVRLLARARRRAHERREPAQGADRRARRRGCTRPARATTRWRPTSGSTCATWIDGADAALAAPAAGARAQGGGAQRPRHAGLHAPAAGAARHLRPSSARLRRDAGARPRPARRCARAAQRVPAGRRRARRHVLPDRPARDGRGAGLRPADAPTRSTPSPTATSRWRRSPPPPSPPCTCRASPRRSCSG